MNQSAGSVNLTVDLCYIFTSFLSTGTICDKRHKIFLDVKRFCCFFFILSVFIVIFLLLFFLSNYSCVKENCCWSNNHIL